MVLNETVLNACEYHIRPQEDRLHAQDTLTYQWYPRYQAHCSGANSRFMIIEFAAVTMPMMKAITTATRSVSVSSRAKGTIQTDINKKLGLPKKWQNTDSRFLYYRRNWTDLIEEGCLCRVWIESPKEGGVTMKTCTNVKEFRKESPYTMKCSSKTRRIIHNVGVKYHHLFLQMVSPRRWNLPRRTDPEAQHRFEKKLKIQNP